MFESLAPLMRAIESLASPPIGLSVVGVGEK